MDNIQGYNQPAPTPPPAQLPCNPPSPTQFELAFSEYGKIVAPLLSAAVASQTNSARFADTKKDSVCTARTVGRYIYKGVKEYSLFNDCITIAVTKESEELVTTAKEAIDKSAKLTTGYKAAVDSIKAAKQKVEQVKNAADKLYEDILNSCNSEEVKQIKSSLGNGNNKKNLEASVSEFAAYALKITNNIDDVSESAVKVAGINAFINVQSLDTAFGIIKKGADDFVKDVEANVKSLQTDYDAAKKDLAEGQKLFSAATLVKYKSTATRQALERIKKFTDNPECHTCGDGRRLNELVQKAAESFNESCSDETTEETAGNDEEEYK